MLNRGEYDALLPWPLEFQSTVTIIPPTGSAEQPIILDMEARSMKSPQPHLPITYKYALVLDLQKLCKFASHDTIFVRGVHREKFENTMVYFTMFYHSLQHRTTMVFSNTSLLLYVVVKNTTNYNIRVMYHDKTL